MAIQMHTKLVNELQCDVGKNIIIELCKRSPTIRHNYKDLGICYWCLKEFTVRFDRGIVCPDGKFMRTRRVFDAILMVEPSINSLSQRWTFKVGIEVKSNLKDLLADNKMQYYLGWTDFFFIGVPDNLIDSAIEKASGDIRIGVVSLNSGKVIKMPAWQDVTMGRKWEIMEQAFYNYMTKGIDKISFKASI